jgi:hypothetical protein
VVCAIYLSTLCQRLNVHFHRSLRAYRILAINFVLTWQSQGPKELRAQPEALLLVAALIWLANGLHSRPDDGSAARNLMTAVLPRVERNGADPDTLAFCARTDGEDVGETLPYNPYGLVFFTKLKVVGVAVPRFYLGHRLEDFAFKYYFGKDYDAVANTIFPVGIVRPPTQVPRNRVIGNRTQMTCAPFQPENEPQQTIFELAAQGYQLPPRAIDNGSEIEVDSEEEDLGIENIDAVVTNIWRSFLCDLLTKSPNPKGALLPSYCRLPSAARSQVKVGPYGLIRLILDYLLIQTQRKLCTNPKSFPLFGEVVLSRLARRRISRVHSNTFGQRRDMSL